MSLNENANGYLASANESGSARQNVSEGAVLELGNENETGQSANDRDRGDRDHHRRQMNSLFRRIWVKVVHGNVHDHGCDRHANANVPARSSADSNKWGIKHLRDDDVPP